MVKKTFKLSEKDQEYMISIISRYRATKTIINESTGELTVYTTFANNEKPTSIAAKFQMELISEDPPEMPEHEYKRRVMGIPG